MGKKVVRVAAVSCLHAPFIDEGAFSKALRFIQDFDPHHLLVLGDLFEGAAASVHPHEHQHTLKDEYDMGAWALNELEGVCRKRTSRTWLLGNHDDNLQTCDPRRIPPALRSSLNWNTDKDYGDTFRRWRQVPYTKSLGGLVRIGQVVFSHGWDAGNLSNQTEAIQAQNLLGGRPHLLCVRGHTHRPLQPTQVMRGQIPLPLWCANTGHLGPPQPHYMQRKDTSRWGHGLFLGETLLSRHVLLRPEWWGTVVDLGDKHVPLQKPRSSTRLVLPVRPLRDQ